MSSLYFAESYVFFLSWSTVDSQCCVSFAVYKQLNMPFSFTTSSISNLDLNKRVTLIIKFECRTNILLFGVFPFWIMSILSLPVYLYNGKTPKKVKY